MLSLSTEYAGQSSAKNIENDWLLELTYDAGTYYFSGSDKTLTNFYHGNVLDWGVIDESIDIKNSQSSISDVKIVLANSWANDSGLLSAELFGGSKKFINQDVTIKSWIAGLALTDCLTLYKGRLIDIQHNQDTVILTIEKRSPWDRVKLGGTVSTNNRIPFPIAYGDYTRNASTVASKDFCTSRSLWPMPVNDIIGDNIMCLLLNKTTPTSENAHYYEPNLDIFIPIDPVNTASDSSYQGGDAIAAANTLKRGFDYRPTTINSSDPDEFTNPENAVDGNTATYATKSFSDTGNVSEGFSIYIDVPSTDGRLTDIDIAVKYELIIDGASGPDSVVLLQDRSYGASAPQLQTVNSNTTEGTTVEGAETIHTVDGYTTWTWFNSDRYSAGNTLPSYIHLLAGFIDVIPAEVIIGEVRIYDIIIRVASQVDFSGEESASYEKLKSLDRLYTGTDGFDQDWTNGTGGAYYPHDIYRDMLDRYTNWDATGINYVEANGSDWNTTGTPGISIDQDRDWTCRWWSLDPIKLEDVLSQLQFEGCFLWLFDNTSTGREARVIYVKASYSAADFSLDYNDITNISISMTPFSEIVTKRTFNYQRHPAKENLYLAANSKTNSNRTDYNLAASENHIEQNLDFLTATGDVDEALTYYDNIVGEPKLIVKCDLLKPADWALQVGDTATFANMKYEPYGKSWTTPIYFMCTKTQVSPNKFTATFREVG